MSADKRTPHTDALDTLGKIHRYEEHRDAIHLGVEPVEAGEDLFPGNHICIKQGVAFAGHQGNPVGIVDPFLTETVKKGERFWCVVYPRKIKSLRHVWEHPDFPPSGGVSVSVVDDTESRRNAAEVWMRRFCDTQLFPFEQIMKMGFGLANGRTVGEPCDDDYYNHTWGFHEYKEETGIRRSYFVFYGQDIHLDSDEVPDEFWIHLENLVGKPIPEKYKNSSFICSC